MTLKIGTSGENSLVFKPHFHLLEDYERPTWLNPDRSSVFKQANKQKLDIESRD